MQAGKEKHLRVASGRTTTGCQTCRQRRVKCDEAKPICAKCVKAKKQCEYVDRDSTHGGKRFIVYTAPRALTPTPGLVELDRRALHYFRHRVALDMGAPFGSQLWDDSVARLAQQQSFLMSGLAALSAMHESYTPQLQNRDQLQRDALRHYNKAISGITRSAETDLPVEALLVTVVIFFSFESLRGHFQRAVQHVQSGLKIIAERLPVADSQQTTDLRQAVFDAFLALQNQVREFSTPSMSAPFRANNGFQPPYIDHLKSWEDARNQLEIIYNESFNLLDYCQVLGEAQVDLGEVFEDRIKPLYIALFTRFTRWKLGIEKLEVQTDEDAAARLVLKMAEAVFGALYEGFPSASCFDRYHPDIARGLEYAEEFLNTKQRGPQSRRPFSLSFGVVPILHMLVWQCKDATLRNKSLELLGRADRREGMWDSQIAFEMAQKAVAFKQKVGAYDSEPRAHAQISEIAFISDTTCRVIYSAVGTEDTPDESRKLLPLQGAQGERRYIEDIAIVPT